MNTIYQPKGAAKEYGEYALNIYTGCPHRCFYCFAPSVLHKDREAFHSEVKPREGIVEATEHFLRSNDFTGNTVHLCFTCDPYPTGYDSTATRQIIELLKQHGNHVQILTKGDGSGDFDLLDGDDWYGITIDGSEDFVRYGRSNRSLCSLLNAKIKGIKTWISFEPVVDAESVLVGISSAYKLGIDKVKIGKLNYHKSDIDWKKFGNEAEELCKQLGLNYYIKESLRREMDG